MNGKIEELLINPEFLSIKYKLKKKFYNLDRDDIDSAYNVSLWKAQSKFDETRGIKFKTYFYSIFLKELLRLSRKERIRTYPIVDICEIGPNNFFLIMSDLSEDDRNLLIQRYLERKTLVEIGEENGYSYEEARLRINKCIDSLRIE